MAIFAMVTTKKSLRYTEQALYSFFLNTPLAPNDTFILIDNDLALAEKGLEAQFPITVVRNQTPLSFAANANQSARIAHAQKTALYFLNNDVIFTREWLTATMRESSSIIVPLSNREVQYTLPLSEAGETFSVPMTLELESFLGHEEHLAKIVELHRENSAQVSPLLKVLCAPFFVVRIPFAILDAIGGFDLRYGIGGGEDYDYCLRAALAGFDVCYSQQSFLLHFGGKSISNNAQNSEPPFVGVFKERWGDRLAQIIFDDRPDIASVVGAPTYDYQKQGFGRLIREMSSADCDAQLKLEFSCSQ